MTYLKALNFICFGKRKKIAYACIKFANVLNSSLLLFWCNIYLFFFFSQEIQLHCCHKTCMGEQVSSLWIFIFISKWRHISMATERNAFVKRKIGHNVLFICAFCLHNRGDRNYSRLYIFFSLFRFQAKGNVFHFVIIFP